MKTAVTQNDWVGRVIDGRFPLLEWLGSSEKAGVFRTELNQPQGVRAVIRILPADEENPDDRLRGWASAAKLSHPHLMRIFKSGRAQVAGVDVLYVVTEYAEESLAQVIPERPLSTGEARAMLVPILDALSYLHAQSLVHGHLKPSNVTVVEDRIKLPVESVRMAPTTAPRRMDLEPYDAPEVANGAISPPADVWSLGATLVEALTQNPPQWDRSTTSDPSIPPEISEPFAGIARACLRCEPAKRSNVRQIMDLLNGRPPVEALGRKIPQGVPPEAEWRAPSGGDEPRSRNTTGIMAAIFVLVIVVVAVLAIRARKFEPQPAPPAVQSQPPAVEPPQAAPQTPPSTTATAPSQTPPSTPEAAPVPSTPVTAPASASPPVAQSPAPGGPGAKGEVAQRVMPDVSANANRTIHGTVAVRVRVNVDTNGAVSEATFETPGPSHYYSSKAMDAAKKWQFKAPQVNGQAVPSNWVLRFDFRRDGPDVTAQQVSP